MDWLKNFASAIGLLGFFCVFLFFAFLGGICLHYDIYFWASHIQHHKVNPSWPLCLLIGLVPGVGQLSIPGALITWICSFFM